MAKKTLDLGTSDLLDYIDGVEKRIDHHAGGVRETFRTLCDFVPQHATKLVALTSRKVSDDADTANVLWATLGGHVYAFCYSHATDSIEVRNGSIRGETLLSMNDKMSALIIEASILRLVNNVRI